MNKNMMVKNSNGMYVYKGYEIFPFYSEKAVPKHIIKQYYESEKLRIDRTIRFEKENKNSNVESVDEALEDFFKLISD